ncbi:ATP-binding cassette domain-containing protein [Candidatus Fermentibacteria bacterium]|nr:ATP-binding cassette domain-containing protein [Candidatus Fermentibacteria bacterium]
MEPILSARDVRVSFDGMMVLDRASLTLRPGDSLAVVGGSNSGKSTLVRVLAGLIRPSSGTVLFRGKPVRSYAPLAVPWPAGIGYISQNLGLRSNMTVLDNVQLPLLYHGHVPADDARSRAYALLDALGVTQPLARPAALAPGEAELVALARALILEPHVLLFDNPVVVVDVECSQRVLSLLRDLRSRGLAMVSATSSETIAGIVAESVRLLRQGRMEEP